MDRDYTDAELQAAAQRVANVYARVVNRRLGCTIPVPVSMTFDLEFRSAKLAATAGQAHSTMVMDINMTLFRENVQDFLNQTIPHEMGHLVQFNKFDLRGVSTPGHGVHWKETMRIMGKNPKQFHKLDVRNAVASYKAHVKAKKALLKKLLKESQ